MKKIASKVALATLAPCALAAQVAAEPIDFKGVRVGASKAEFRAALSTFTCSSAMPDCDLLYAADNGAGVTSDTYAGERVFTMSARFQDGKLAVVTIRTRPDSYPRIVAAISSKRGEPHATQSSEIQNGMGAKFKQEVSEWRQPDGSIKVARYGQSLTNGVVTIASSEWLAHLAELQRKQADSAKSDL